MKRKTLLGALALFLTLGLVACGNGDNVTDNDTSSDVEETTDNDETSDTDETTDDENTDTEDVTDGPGYATAAGGITDADRLIDVLSADSPNRAWVAGLGADIVVDGPLYMDGDVEKHSAGEWTGINARKIGFYQRDTVNGAHQVPVGAWSLTANEGIHVNSPQSYFISDGPFLGEVYGDVYVNVPYFRLTGVRINGDIIFATQEYMDTAIYQTWDSEVAEIKEGTDADGETDIVLYQSASGFETNGPLNSSDASANVSNAEPSDLVTGEIRLAE